MDSSTQLYRVFLLTLAMFLTGKQTHAAAWTQSQGKWQAIFSSTAYESTSSFDRRGKVTGSGTNFNKYEINPFFEYGLRDDITLGINPTLQHWQISGNSDTSKAIDFRGCGSSNIITGNQSSGQIAEAEFFIRKRLIEIGNAVFSLQPLVKTPCVLIRDSGVDISWNTYAAELRALAGYGFKWDPILLGSKMRPFAGQYHFADLEVAYRKRPSNLSDQVKIDGTLGFRFNANILMLAQVFSVISAGEENVGKVETSPNVFTPLIDNYGDMKLQLSGVVQATKTSSLQIGIYSDVLGKNYGAGNGVIISLWKGF